MHICAILQIFVTVITSFIGDNKETERPFTCCYARIMHVYEDSKVVQIVQITDKYVAQLLLNGDNIAL